ncbi:type II toxin-antitoxin system RelE family toxin [Candidatus Thiosymbion oneisti]|uniref:type II toxin-antitoxin system RelE family toxin n=1 Tax=Candidatus Thiosymbion oneisti TaxID=589554 RepID=UPI000B7EC8EA|nr:hypothetical protein [Candidatus Thiosymbion oneisti]
MYTIDFAESVKDQLRCLPAHQRVTILDSIEKQLSYEPLLETKNRKSLRPNPIAPWELRVGNLRVFYEVTLDEPHIVKILAVGYKKGNKLYIGNREVGL